MGEEYFKLFSLVNALGLKVRELNEIMYDLKEDQTMQLSKQFKITADSQIVLIEKILIFRDSEPSDQLKMLHDELYREIKAPMDALNRSTQDFLNQQLATFKDHLAAFHSKILCEFEIRAQKKVLILKSKVTPTLNNIRTLELNLKNERDFWLNINVAVSLSFKLILLTPILNETY